jgi:hypothetical protein
MNAIQGTLAGWIQPEPTFRAQYDTLAGYIRKVQPLLSVFICFTSVAVSL